MSEGINDDTALVGGNLDVLEHDWDRAAPPPRPCVLPQPLQAVVDVLHITTLLPPTWVGELEAKADHTVLALHAWQLVLSLEVEFSRTERSHYFRVMSSSVDVDEG